MQEVVITGAARTAIGVFNGALASIPAHELGATAITEALKRANVKAEEVEEVLMGQILTAAAGANPARQAALAAGIPVESTAVTVNQLCGSGLRTVAMGYQSLLTGQADIVVAGGQESMSRSPHALHLRAGTKMGDAKMVDTMLIDALVDVFNNYHMGVTAENVAQRWQITRDQQDAFAAESQRRAAAAQADGKFDGEIVPVTVKGRKGDTVIDKDEGIRGETTYEKLSTLRPVFQKDGTVTAGSSSGINDGGAAVVMMTRETAEKRGATPLARIVSWATAGIDPSVMGAGPIPASRKALALAGWDIDTPDLIEANEAFAAQSCAVVKDLGFDSDKVNVNGGAIALGHPVGASGARVLITLLHEMDRRDVKKGLATLCIGGGMGIAMCIERA